MSRIFDALQRSGTEQSGIEYADMVSVATEVFERPAEEMPAPAVSTSAGEYPSLAVSVDSSSRPSRKAWRQKNFASWASV